MAKLSLKANPTFPATVEIPIAGGESVKVRFTFKHRTKKELEEWIKTREGRSDLESFTSMVEGWDLEDAFTPENIEELLENYIGTALATYFVYIDELVKAKAKN